MVGHVSRYPIPSSQASIRGLRDKTVFSSTSVTAQAPRTTADSGRRGTAYKRICTSWLTPGQLADLRGGQLPLPGSNDGLTITNRAGELLHVDRRKALALALGSDAYRGLWLWRGAQHWARVLVPWIYDLHYTSRVRPLMPNNGVSRAAVVSVADARARCAGGDGRNCRPSNEYLARMTRLSPRTVQRATRVLQLLGCATEVFRGRLRTYVERMAAWRLRDRARGWASVWALHPPRPTVDNSRSSDGLHNARWRALSPHPRRGFRSVGKGSFDLYSPTASYPQSSPQAQVGACAGGTPPEIGGAPRHGRDKGGLSRPSRQVDAGGAVLAAQWLADGQTPAWARRHTPKGWAGVLAGPAVHGWTSADINLALREWVTIGGNWMPASPHRPIGLLGAVLAWHGQLDAPPAAHARAQAAAEAAAVKAEQAAARAQARAAAGRAATAEQRAAARALFASRPRP